MYDDTALERLQQILLFKELQFTLKEIKAILDSPDFDRGRVLEQQIQLLELRKEHLQNLIDLARGIKMIGVKHMSFERLIQESLMNTPGRQRHLGDRPMPIKSMKRSP